MFSFRKSTSPCGQFWLHATISIIFGTTPAWAQDDQEIEELIVTASLEPVEAAVVSSSVTVITREEIEQKQVRYLSDLLRDVPGFAVSQAGGPGSLTQVRVRGSEANQLLVLIDGIRANDPASGDEFQFQYALTSNIERIEIVRGPQSAIWGTDALAGVINIIRRTTASEGAGRYDANFETGSFGTREGGVSGAGRFGRATLSGGIEYLETDGINASREGDEKDGADNLNLNGRLALEASESLDLIFTGQRVEATTEFDGISFVTGLPEDSDQYTEADRTYLGAEGRFTPQGSRWRGSAAINYLDTDNSNYAFGSPNGSTSAETLEFRLRTSVLLGRQANGNHRLTFALDREDVDFSQRGVASAFGDPNQDQSYDVTGLAAEYAGRTDSGFNWNFSGRHDDFSDFDDATTWQFGISRWLESGIRVRGTVGTGSKAPTFIERYGFFPELFIGNPDLKPETSEGWEIGVDMPLGETGLGLSATYFSQDLEDEINGFIFDPETFLFTAENEIGTSERQGVELMLDGSLGEQLTFVATYTYTDATQPDPEEGTIREVRRPRHMASISANYVFADGRANLNLGIEYNGEQLDNFFPPPSFARTTVKLDDYTVVGLRGSWQINSQWEATARVENLFDEDYEEVLGFARPGRAAYVGLRARLGR